MKRAAGLAGLVVFVVAAILVPSAAASTGSFTHATVDPEWKKAMFGVTGGSSVCTIPGKCSWFPVVVAIPPLPEYRCGFGTQNALDSDPNTRQIWSELPARTSDGPFSGEATDTAISAGLYGQRLCLGIIGTHMVNDVVCEAQKPVFEEFGLGPISCPPVERAFEEDLVSILPTVQTPAVSTVTPTTTTPSPSSTAKPKFRCPKGKKKIVRKGKPKCVRRHKRKHKAEG